MMWVWLLLAILFLTFVFVDLWYFLRFVPTFTRSFLLKLLKRSSKRLSSEDLFKASIIDGIVLPSDMDWSMHMNNSKYLREMDFGRIFHVFESGLYRAVKAKKALLTIAAINIRYRRSLHLWDRFQLHTRIVYWDDNEFFYEQRFVGKNEFVCAVALVKVALRRITSKEVFEAACVDGCPKRLSCPSQLEAWKEALQRSSDALKTE